MASIEGRRGQPRPRPPFPAVKGLWGKPTNINNVETYANVPQIILRGADWFASMGTARSKGTKTFAIAGDAQNAGLIEVPMGITLREVIYDVGGGIKDGKRFKAVQTGGPMGGCLPTQYLDMEVDYESLVAAGSMMGSGGMIVMDEDTCMVDIARFFMEFTQDESCGKCTPCRVGTRRILEILERICAGDGRDGDIEALEMLCQQIKSTNLCGLGQGAPNPVESTLKHFRAEYEAHIHEKRRPAGVCKGLVRALCVNRCPAGVDSPAYLALVAQGRYAEGLAVHRDANPLALVCGRASPSSPRSTTSVERAWTFAAGRSWAATLASKVCKRMVIRLLCWRWARTKASVWLFPVKTKQAYTTFTSWQTLWPSWGTAR
jgi:NADH-quinone oxidoreductase subunit F